MNNRILLMTLICGLLLAAGCSGPLPRTSYYSLHAPAQPAAPAPAPAGGARTVSVGPVVIPDILRQTQIATGGADGRYQLSEHHRWSGDVDRDFARALAEQLAHGLGTERVAIFPSDQHMTPTCRVLVDVLNMGGATGQEASLAVRWTLVDPAGKVPALVRRSELREVPAAAGYPAWVAAQQRNIARLGEEIAVAVKETFKP